MICVAIDGPAGSGKSTVSKLLAQRLSFKNFINLDTGALYRAVAFYFLENNLNINKISELELKNILNNIKIKIKNSNFEQEIFLNNINITHKIRTEEISKTSSEISGNLIVREYLLDLQRDFAKNNNVIMDGRDIGTVIMPNSNIKIFLTASAEKRARRRYLDLTKNSKNIDYNLVLEDLKIRDKNDMSRKVSPLKVSQDYIIIDNSDYNLEETVNMIFDIIMERVNI